MHRTASTVLLMLVLLLLLFGTVMLYSTSYTAFETGKLARQLTWIAMGGIGALVLWRLDYRPIARMSWVFIVLVALSLAYLAAVALLYKTELIPRDMVAKLPLVGGPIKGSFRWLRFGPASLQPSEFAKLFLVLFLADYYNRRARHAHEIWRGFLRPLAIAGFVIGLVFLGKDLSTTAITGAIVLSVMFVAGVRLRYLGLVAIFGLLFVGVMIKASPERMARMMAFRDPEAHQYDDGYQLWVSQLALGSGGVGGVGFTKSRMKQLYLPEAHTDFIVAIIGEELGFAGIMFVLTLYACTMLAAFWIGLQAVDRTGLLLGVGVGLGIGLQAFVNISVVSGFCPTTGVTAPFLSYGGSSMLAALLSIGILLSVARIAEQSVAEGEGNTTVRARKEPTYRQRARGSRAP